MADNYFGNLARATLGQGLAMGWGDELEAKLRSLRGPETYEEELAMIQDSYKNKGSHVQAGSHKISLRHNEELTIGDMFQ